MLTLSKVLCVSKQIFHKPELFNYAGTNEYVLATEEELTKAPWDTMIITPNLRGKARSMKFARPFVKLSECATHVKDIQWSDDLVTPRLSWLCKYLPKVWKKLDQESRQLAFLMGTHGRLGQGTFIRTGTAGSVTAERYSPWTFPKSLFWSSNFSRVFD